MYFYDHVFYKVLSIFEVIRVPINCVLANQLETS